MRVGSALAGLMLGFAAVLAPAMLIAQSPAPAPPPAPVPVELASGADANSPVNVHLRGFLLT